MATFRAGTADQTAFLDALTDAGLLIPSGVPGVVGRGSGFEAVRVGVDRMVDRNGRIAVSLPDVLAWTLAPTQLAVLKNLV